MHKIYFGRAGDTIKITNDVDCLPPDCTHTYQALSTADIENNRGDESERFWHIYDKVRWIENLGITICIDFPHYFYETGMQGPDVKDREGRWSIRV